MSGLPTATRPTVAEPTVLADAPSAGRRARVSPFALLRRLWSDADLRRSGLSVFDQGIVSGTNFATSVLIGRLCTQSELGVYYLALSVWVFVRGLQDQVILAPYMIYCPRRKEGEAAAYLGSSLAHNLLFTLLAFAGLGGLAAVVGLGYGPAGLGTTAWVLLGTIPFLLLREFIRNYAFCQLRLGLAIGVDVVSSTFQIGGILLLGWTGHLTVASAYAVVGGACAIATLGWFALRPPRMTIARTAVASDWRHNWGFARWALVCHLFTSTTPFVMPWVVAFASGEAATGLLAACTTIIGLANVVVMGLANYLSPKAAHAYGHGGTCELGLVLRKTWLLFTAILGPFALLTLVAGGPLVAFVYGRQYAGAGSIVAVLAFGMLASSWSITAGNGLWAMERPAANLRADVASFVVSVIATILLVPPLGPLGAALVTLSANVVDAGVRGLTLRVLMAERRHVEDRDATRAEASS